MSATTTTPKENVFSGVFKRLSGNLQTYALVVAMVVIWGMFDVLTSGSYLSPQNFSNLFRQMTVSALLSVGMVLVIVTGNIDLSVGRLAGFVSVFVAYLQLRTWHELFPGRPLEAAILSVIAGCAIGTIYGVVQGWIIAYQRVPSFIVTLGSMWILNGLILIRTEGKTLAANQNYFVNIADG